MKDYGLNNLDIKDNRKVKETALKMSEDGFCTHYPGYICDKDFPEECPKCIERWIKRHCKKPEN